MDGGQISLYSSITGLETAIKSVSSRQNNCFDSFGTLTGFAVLRGFLKSNVSDSGCKYTVILKEHQGCVNSIEQLAKEVRRGELLRLKKIDVVLYDRLKDYADTISSIDGNTLVGKSFVLVSGSYFKNNVISVLSNIGTNIREGISTLQCDNVDRVSPRYMDEIAVLYKSLNK